MQQESLIADAPETGKRQKKLEPVQLRTAHDFSLVTQALEIRKEDLKRLSKKTSDEGYTREAKVMESDALAIEHHILPSFSAQRELPLVTPEQVEKEVEAAIRRAVFYAFDGLAIKGAVITPAGIEARRNTLLSALTQRIAQFATELAEDAFNQGTAARENTPEALTLRSISALRTTAD